MASSLPPALARLIKPNPLAQNHSRSLYETLSRLPKDGVGSRVTQPRWAAKGIQNSYWEITKVRIKDEGRHGKVWGRLFWKGQLAMIVEPFATRWADIILFSISLVLVIFDLFSLLMTQERK